jgi:hypothetical protein
MFEAAFASLSSVCERTRQELASYRQQRPGDTDAAFLEQSVHEFIRAGRETKDPRPGLRMMALSVYALVVKCDEVARLTARVAQLEDALDMRDDALAIAWDIIDKHDNNGEPDEDE